MEREELEVEDILQFRALARVGLMAEEEAHLTYQTTAAGGRVDEGGRPLSNRKTWWEWARGSSSADDAVMTADAVPESVNVGGEIKLSDEQRDKLAALLSGKSRCSAPPPLHAAASCDSHAAAVGHDEDIIRSRAALVLGTNDGGPNALERAWRVTWATDAYEYPHDEGSESHGDGWGSECIAHLQPHRRRLAVRRWQRYVKQRVAGAALRRAAGALAARLARARALRAWSVLRIARQQSEITKLHQVRNVGFTAPRDRH